MRIVIDTRYVNDRFPGIGRYAYNLARALAALDNDDELLLLHNPALSDSRFDVAGLASPPRCRVVRCPVPRWLPTELLRLPGIARRLHPDVFHSPFFLRPFRLGCATAVTVFDVIPLHRGMAWRDTAVFRVAARVGCRASDAVITASNSAAAEIRRWLPSVAWRLHVTPLAADPAFRRLPEATAVAVRRRLQLPERYVLHVGAHLPHKRVDRLIAAWEELDRCDGTRQEATLLVLAGPAGPQTPHLRRSVRRLGLERSVRFLGPVAEHDLPALYAGATAVVLPSAMEGFGLPALEAMACGAPVVTSAAGSLAEVVGDAAVLVDPEDPRALAAELAGLLSEPHRRAELAARGAARAAEFTWEATARATRRAYVEAVRG